MVDNFHCIAHLQVSKEVIETVNLTFVFKNIENEDLNSVEKIVEDNN